MSKIQWTEQTWNPIIGCSKISPGCENCYAEKMAGRLANMRSTYYYMNVVKIDDDIHSPYKAFGEWDGKTHFVSSQLQNPMKRKKPTMYFVCSMGDLFHESVPFEWIDKVMAVIGRSQQHTFQILTKRPVRMKEYLMSEGRYDNILKEAQNISFYPEGLGIGISSPKDLKWWPNIWLGVTCENQEQANKRIPILLDIPAKVRFVSIEPMLDKVDLTRFFPSGYWGIHPTKGEMWYPKYYMVKCKCGWIGSSEYLGGGGPIADTGDNFDCYCPSCEREEDWVDIEGKLDWVICGGESGPNARPMHPDWVKSLRDQCESANVPFFFKQWGEWRLHSQTNMYELYGETGKHPHEFNYYDSNLNKTRTFGGDWIKCGKKAAGSLLKGIEYKQYPKP